MEGGASYNLICTIMSRGGYGYWGVADRRLGGTGFGCFGETGKPDRSYGIGCIAQGSPHDLGTRRHIGLEPYVNST